MIPSTLLATDTPSQEWLYNAFLFAVAASGPLSIWIQSRRTQKREVTQGTSYLTQGEHGPVHAAIDTKIDRLAAEIERHNEQCRQDLGELYRNVNSNAQVTAGLKTAVELLNQNLARILTWIDNHPAHRPSVPRSDDH